MKKVLLFAVLAMTAIVTDAKPLSVEKIKRPALSERIAAQQPKKAGIFGKKNASKRSMSTGLYYKRPEGTMYTCFNEEGNGYGQIFLSANPFVNTQFVPVVAEGTQYTWHMNILNASGVATNSWDISEMADSETGVLNFPIEVGSSYPLPTIVSATDSFTIGHTPYSERTYSGNYYWSKNKALVSRIIADSIAPHSFIDDHAGSAAYWGVLTAKNKVTYNGNVYDYLFGTGTFQMDRDDTPDSLAVSMGVEQYFEKPQTPLYVENVFINASTFAEKPIVGDAKLVMTINNAVYDEKAGMYVPGNKLIATLECTAEDLSNFQNPEAFGDGKLTEVVLTFKQKKTSALGTNVEPFTIDEPFIVTVTGFEQEGVDINLRGHENPVEDTLEDAYMIFNINGNIISRPFYTDPVSVPFIFNSCFDWAEVWESAETSDQKLEDFNVLMVSNDGKTVSNKGYADANFTYANTAFTWFNADDEENYLLLDTNQEDMPEWIVNYYAESEKDEQYGSYTGRTMLSVECEALPEGVKGRYAVLYIYGRGYTSTTPLIIIQGDVDLNEIKTVGIKNTSVKPISSEKFFNLNGQQVTKATKGLVIKDGKKYINK